MSSSSNPPQSSAPIDPAKQSKARKQLLLIFALFGIPLLLATIWLHMVRSSGGALGDTSRGELIVPAVPITAFALTDQVYKTSGTETGSFDHDELKGMWTLLYLPVGDCLDTCQTSLYHMRQVRLALNHRMDRVQRVTVAESDAQLSQELRAQHPGLHVLTGTAAAREALTAQIAAAIDGMSAEPDAIYLVDPLGNVMMRFAPDLPPNLMLKDLKHLLKVSRIG